MRETFKQILLQMELILLLFSHLVIFNSLWLHGLQQTRLPCSYLPKFAQIHVHWVGDDIEESHPLQPSSPFTFNLSQHQSLFFNEWALCIRWLKYWSFSFSISPFNEYSGLISFRIDWFNLFTIQGTLKRLLQQHSSKASILRPSALWSNSHICTWVLEKHSFNYMDIYQQTDVLAF